MTLKRIVITGVGAALAALAQPLAGQGAAPNLTLGDALRIARTHAYANRAASATATAAAATATGALRGVLPGVSAEASVLRTNEPIAAFGFALKQRGVSQASFAPQALNHPSAITNVGTGLLLELPLANADAWFGLRSARAAASAATASAQWTASTVSENVIHAYFGAVVATQLARTMADAETAAREHVRSAELAATNGFVTSSDALLARVRAGDVTVQRIEAESRARLARAGLATLLGVPADTAVSLPEALPTPTLVRARLANAVESHTRGDVLAASEARRAASLDLKRAQGALLPRINGFARYDWNAPSRIGGGSPAWTIGAAASWSLFGGGRELADIRSAQARLYVAEAGADGAAAAAELALRSTDENVTVAFARAAIADTAVDHAAEAMRIVRRKYDGGIAVISELLDAAAAHTQTRLMQADASYRLIAAIAARLRARGADPAALAILDPDLR
ncbi:MAG: TolC family protein [Gemmatimonadota bacterium]|nr:TolC family protein [Gemmatimonadota bacterium]